MQKEESSTITKGKWIRETLIQAGIRSSLVILTTSNPISKNLYKDKD